MSRRVVRLALFLVGLAAAGVAALLAQQTLRQSRAERQALQTIDSAARRALASATEMRFAIQAYVAAGQGIGFWQGRLLENLDVLKEELARLRQLGTDPAGLNDLDAAASALDAFTALEGRALRLVRVGQVKLASQEIFATGIETLAVVASRVDAARARERQAFERRTDERERLRGYAAAGAVAIGLMVAALLLPVGRSRKTAHSEADRAADSPTPSPSTAVDVPPRAEPPAAPAPEPVPAGSDGPPRADRRKATELKALAELCTDFARLTDSQELPGLLERAARLMDAAGFIVWVTDAEGLELRPALTHGYPPQALSRLPAIPRDAANATAAAWRDADLRVVKTNGMTPGALVTPLMTTTGCIGVLTAEVRHGRESSEAVRALTRIIAAQLATLVTVPPQETERADAGTRECEGA
jgi:hypothetical protein